MAFVAALSAIEAKADPDDSAGTNGGQEAARPAPRLTRAPALTRFVEASLPADDAASRREASVVLRLTVGEDGLVREAEVIEPAGAPYDEAARTAALQFVFTPAEVDGQAAAINLLYRYDFTVKAAAPTTARFSGAVRDRPTRRPMPGVSVTLVDGLSGRLDTVTDAEGRFQFDAVPAGSASVALSGAGLTSLRTQEQLDPGQHLEVMYDVTVPAAESAAAAGEADDMELVVVAPPLRRQAVTSSVAAELAVRLPGTQGDVLKVVESMPGVGRAAAGSGALVVWGASPQDTRTYVDGVPVPRLYHQGGLRSVVSSDMVRKVDLVPGGYGASYGRGLGGLVSVETAPLEGEGFHGGLGVDLFESSAALRAHPTNRLHVAVAGRHSHLDTLAGAFVPGQVQSYFPFPRYDDGQVRLQYDLGPAERLQLVGLFSNDHVSRGVPDADPSKAVLLQQDQSFQRVYLRYDRTFPSGAVVAITPWLGWDQSALVDQVGAFATQTDRRSTMGGLRASWRAPVSQSVVAEAGLDAEVVRSTDERRGSLGLPAREGDRRVFGQPPPEQLAADSWWTTHVGVAPYVELEVTPWGPALRIIPGLRLDPYARSVSRSMPVTADTPEIGLFAQDFSIEPRLTVRWTPNERAHLHAAAGRYRQAPASDDLSAVFGNPTLPSANATHLLLGGELKLTDGLTLEPTGFLSLSDSLAVRSSDASPRVAEALVATGEGRAYGGQLLLRQAPVGGFFGWLSYSLIRSERRNDASSEWRTFDYDQTHLLTALGALKIWGDVDVGLRFRLASGYPRTAVTAAYYDARLDRWQPVLGERNGVRLPMFLQADLRASREWKLPSGKLEAALEVQNLTNASNAEELVYSNNFSRSGYITGLPVLVVAGLRWSFQ